MKRSTDNIRTISAALRRSTRAKAMEQFLSDLLTKDEQEHIAQRIQFS